MSNNSTTKKYYALKDQDSPSIRKGWKQLGDKDGFSLTEMLATVLIMSLVTMAIATGITTAVRVYRQITLKADAQTLMATSIVAINNDFATADFSCDALKGYTTAVTEDLDAYGMRKIPLNEPVKFRSIDRGYDVSIHNGEVKHPDGKSAGNTIYVTDSIQLVTEKTRTFDLHNQISDISLYAHYIQDPDSENDGKRVMDWAYFTYTMSVYSEADINNPIETERVSVNNTTYLRAK